MLLLHFRTALPALIFRDAATNAGLVNLEQYASAITSYINKCVEDVITTRTIIIHSTQKPWLNAAVRYLLRGQDSGDAIALRAGRRKLTEGNKRTKAAKA